MQQLRHRRFASLLAAAAILVLSAGAGAAALIQLPIREISIDELFQVSLDVDDLFQVKLLGLRNTGFSILSRDGSALNIEGTSKYDPALGLQPGQRVQEGFVLLDGTLAVNVAALKTLADGTRVRAPTLTTYRLDVRRPTLDPRNLARTLVHRGLVDDLTNARIRVRSLRPDDTRVMRLVQRDDNRIWIRAVKAIPETRGRVFRPLMRPPDGALGHFGFARSADGDPYVWAVMDRNSQYAVGLNVDRDGDGVNNWADNCVGSSNSNQLNTDGDGSGDECDLDDDNDSKADTADNCPLQPNNDQLDHDADGAGDVCDVDDDGDNVLDSADRCQATVIGSIVAGDGCSIVDTCPCENSWRNHGAYVKCIAQTSNSFLTAGLITSTQKDALVSAAAQSVCGF
jgi:hypothetical protein